MTVLLFNHSGWEVMTASWTAAAKPGNKVQIAYVWGANWISAIDSATGVAKTELNISLGDFWKRIGRGGAVIDLRDLTP